MAINLEKKSTVSPFPSSVVGGKRKVGGYLNTSLYLRRGLTPLGGIPLFEDRAVHKLLLDNSNNLGNARWVLNINKARQIQKDELAFGSSADTPVEDLTIEEPADKKVPIAYLNISLITSEGDKQVGGIPLLWDNPLHIFLIEQADNLDQAEWEFSVFVQAAAGQLAFG